MRAAMVSHSARHLHYTTYHSKVKLPSPGRLGLVVASMVRMAYPRVDLRTKGRTYVNLSKPVQGSVGSAGAWVG